MSAKIFGAAAALLALSLAAAWPGAAQAQTSATRASSFAYDAGSGLLTQEVIEPSQSAYRLQTDYVYNAFGQKTQVTVSGVDIATRSASTTYDALGQFATSAANALSQSESWQYDTRFGLPTSHTGPNGLTTTWTYDSFGRKTLEVRADGTRTAWSYQYCSGIAGGTASCPSGGTYLVQTTQLAADGSTQIGPTSTAYFDQLGRTIAADTQGFDGSLIRSATQYDAQGRVLQKSRPYFVSGGTPKWTTYTYDTLSRVLTETNPDTSVTSRAYHGLTTSVTNALSQTSTTLKNSQGQTVSVTDAQSQSTTYIYEPFGNMVQVTDAASNVSTYSYDVRGRKTASSDPDMGSWGYTYNVLDQLVTQTNAAGQVTTVTYDLLGRTTQRTEPDLTSTWTYDTAAMGVGKLASAATNTGYSRSHAYDTLGRPAQVQLTIASTSYAISTGYDAASRVNAVTYPSGFAVAYAYNGYGYQTQLTNSATSQVYWTATARDAEGHLTQQTAGNGITTSQTFDANTGLLTGITAGSSGTVESFSYTYDTLGKLLTRGDTNTGLAESFGYDSLNRLTSTSVNLSPTPLNKSFTYSAIGNLISKSDVGTYSYPASGQPLPHAVTSISGGLINTSFTYDAKGNMTAGNGLTVAYASYNKPTSITRGTSTIGFSHDPEHQRFQQVAPGGTTLYLGNGAAYAEKFTGSDGSVRWSNYLVAAGGLVGMHVENSDETVLTRYFHKDHLGSIAVITNESGTVLERLSYDAWGKRRYADGSDDPAGAITSQTNRGFTGHEELDSVGLVHMNGRVYDPLLARFGTPDPFTESPFSTQGWNRYSYVDNSPLNFTDPSGYCIFGCFWKHIFKSIQNLFRQVPILGTIVQVAAGVLCGPVCAVVASTLITGITSGNLGLALKAGFISAVTIGAFQLGADLFGDFAGLGGAQGPPQQANYLGGAGDAAQAACGGAVGGCMVPTADQGPSPTQLSGIVVTSDPVLSTGPSIGQGLFQGTVNAIPGAFYSGLALGQFRAGNYGPAVAYTLASFADSALAVATWGVSARLTAGARQSISLAQRAAEIHNALDPIAQAQRTTAVLQTNAGRIVAGGARDLVPAQRAMLTVDEIAARMPGVHAEITAIEAAQRLGLTPVEMAVTREICALCAVAIEATGGRLTGPTTVVWPKP